MNVPAIFPRWSVQKNVSLGEGVFQMQEIVGQDGALKAIRDGYDYRIQLRVGLIAQQDALYRTFKKKATLNPGIHNIIGLGHVARYGVSDCHFHTMDGQVEVACKALNTFFVG